LLAFNNVNKMKLTNVHENITLFLLRQIIFKIQARRKLNGEEFRKFEVAKVEQCCGISLLRPVI